MLHSIGSQRVGHDWATEQQKQISNKDLLYSTRKYIDYLIITYNGKEYIYIYIWRRQWQSTLVLLPGESEGWGSLVGCRLWGHRVGHD